MAWTVLPISPLDGAIDVLISPTCTWSKTQYIVGEAPMLLNVFSDPAELGVPANETVNGKYWNAFGVGTGGTMNTSLKDINGVDTEVMISFRDGWDYGMINSVNVTTPVNGDFASDTIAKSFAKDLGAGVYIDISGLVPHTMYKAYILAAGDPTSGNQFTFMAESGLGTSASIDGYNVTVPETYQELPYIVVPSDANGDLSLELYGASYAMINALVLELDASISEPEPSTALRIATDETLQTGIVINEALATATQYNVDETQLLSNETLYYWGVSLDGGTTFDHIFAFTTVDYPPLSVPILTSPVNEAGNVSNEPLLEWGMVLSANKYLIKIFSDDTLVNLVHEAFSLEAQYQVTDGVLEFNKAYYWQVKALNTGTLQQSDWSAPFMFTTWNDVSPKIPVPVYPHQNQLDVETNVVLAWTDGGFISSLAAEIDYFVLDLADNSAFTDPILHAVQITGLTYAIALQNSAAFYWRVKVVLTNGKMSDFCAIQTFTTIGISVNQVIITSPLSNDVVERTVQFTWTEDPHASTYDLQVSTTPDFSTMVLQEAIDTNTVTRTFLYSTKYYARVRAKNNQLISAWSEVVAFITLPKTGGSIPTSMDLLITAQIGASGQITLTDGIAENYYNTYGIDLADIRGIFKVYTDSEVIYENPGYGTDDFSTPDVDGSVADWSISGLQAAVDANGIMAQGIIHIGYKVNADGTDAATYTAEYSYTNTYITPSIVIKGDLDIRASIMQVSDLSNFSILHSGVPTTPVWEDASVVLFKVEYPFGSNQPDLTSFIAPFYVGPNLWTGTFKIVSNHNLIWSRLLTGTGLTVIIADTITTITMVNVVREMAIYDVERCLLALSQNYEAAKKYNLRNAQNIKNFIDDISLYYEMYKLATSIGNDTSYAITKLYELMNLSGFGVVAADSSVSQVIYPSAEQSAALIPNATQPQSSTETPNPANANYYEGDDYIYHYINGIWKKIPMSEF